jgi:hypothetical protein
LWTGLEPCGPTAFQRLYENLFDRKNGHTKAELMGQCLDQWDLIRENQPRPASFCKQLDRLRCQEGGPSSVSMPMVSKIPTVADIRPQER